MMLGIQNEHAGDEGIQQLGALDVRGLHVSSAAKRCSRRPERRRSYLCWGDNKLGRSRLKVTGAALFDSPETGSVTVAPRV